MGSPEKSSWLKPVVPSRHAGHAGAATALRFGMGRGDLHSSSATLGQCHNKFPQPLWPGVHRCRTGVLILPVVVEKIGDASLKHPAWSLGCGVNWWFWIGDLRKDGKREAKVVPVASWATTTPAFWCPVPCSSHCLCPEYHGSSTASLLFGLCLGEERCLLSEQPFPVLGS